MDRDETAAVEPSSPRFTRARAPLIEDRLSRGSVLELDYGVRDDYSEPETGWSAKGRRAASIALLVLLLLALAAAVLVPAGWVRTTIVFLAALFVVGGSILTRVRVLGVLHALALAIGLSLAVEGVIALLMLKLHLWNPVAAGLALSALAAALLVTDIRSDDGDDTTAEHRSVPGFRRSAFSVVRPSVPLLFAGLVLWVLSLHAAASPAINVNGLLDSLPTTWYVALGATVLAATSEIWWTDMSPVLVAVCIAATATVLYATIPILEQYPQYAYTYKHIGVTRLFLSTGRAFPDVDIYNRWPAFFAAAAAFARIAAADPLTFAKWFEPAFALVDALIVAAIGRYVSGSARIAALAALLWLGVNWVGQGYFSPQAFAYTLGLVVTLILVLALGDDGLVQRWVLRILGAVFRRRQTPRALTAPNPWRALSSALVALACAVVIAAAHQLTPYLLTVEAAVLVCFGLRPRWIPVALLAVAVGFLIPNFQFVNSHWGLFTGLDPFTNSKVTTENITRPWLYANDGRLLTLASLMLACAAALGIAISGRAGAAALLIAMAFAPYSLVAVSSYGGEGILRAALFSSPWIAILVAWGLYLLPHVTRFVFSSAVAVGLIGLFVIGFMANASFNVIPAGEVLASDYFYQHAPAGSVLFQAGADFPAEIGARYRLMADPATNASPDLFGYPFAESKRFGARSLQHLIVAMNELSLTPFVAFSTSGYRLLEYEHIASPRALRALEHAVATSPLFKLWYANGDTRIYELVG